MKVWILHQNDRILFVTDDEEFANEEKVREKEKYKGVELGNNFYVTMHYVVRKV